MLDPHDLCRDYLAALETADLDAVSALFAANGVVNSPLYGQQDAREFYAALFADTERSQTLLKRIYTAQDGSIALHFVYDWTMADGSPASFEVVDVIELDPDGTKIAALTILYDTAPLRATFEEARTTSPGPVGSGGADGGAR
ncbi:MAG: nuclear transport factor 2 family protein [Pseudomonadota bacterium]